jgi:hypothetical protein
MALSFFCIDLPWSRVFRLLVGDVSVIATSSDGGRESGSLVLGLADLAMLVVDLYM